MSTLLKLRDQHKRKKFQYLGQTQGSNMVCSMSLQDCLFFSKHNGADLQTLLIEMMQAHKENTCYLRKC